MVLTTQVLFEKIKHIFQKVFFRKPFLVEKALFKLSPNLLFSLFQKVISLNRKKRLSQDEEKVFSEKKLFYFLEYAHVKKKKRNAFLPTCLAVLHFDWSNLQKAGELENLR